MVCRFNDLPLCAVTPPDGTPTAHGGRMSITRERTAWNTAAQANWEVEGFNRAAARFREAAAVADPTELSSGRRLLRDVVPPLITLIEEAQAGAAEALRQPGRQPEWTWPILLVPAEKAAVITAATAIRAAVVTHVPEGGAQHDEGSPVTVCSKVVSASLRVQIEYDTWAQVNDDVATRLRRKFPDLDRRTWAKWRKRLEVTRCAPWSEGAEVATGAHLLHLLTLAAPTRFVIETRKIFGGRTQRFITATQETRELVEDINTRAEVARPLLMPMIIPPNPWRYDDAPIEDDAPARGHPGA